jgi:hypothetical protein
MNRWDAFRAMQPIYQLILTPRGCWRGSCHRHCTLTHPEPLQCMHAGCVYGGWCTAAAHCNFQGLLFPCLSLSATNAHKHKSSGWGSACVCISFTRNIDRKKCNFSRSTYCIFCIPLLFVYYFLPLILSICNIKSEAGFPFNVDFEL